MRVFVAGIFAFILTIVLPQRAALADDVPNLTNPSKVITTVAPDNVTEIIREIGGQKIEVRESNGVKSITFMDGDVPYNVSFTLCLKAAPNDCKALGLLVLLENNGYSFEALNILNQETLFLTFFKAEKDRIGIARVELVEGGMTKKNLALAIIWFVTEFRESYKRLQDQMTAGLPAQKDGFAAASPRAPRAVPASPEEIAHWTAKLMKQRERTRLGQ